MRPSDRIPLDQCELPAVFPENNPSVLQPFLNMGAFPEPMECISIPLPVKDSPPKIVIADDDSELLKALERSRQAVYPKALDTRYWHPNDATSLVDQITTWMQEEWRPDLVVIDINMAVGGRHGFDYLKELRNKEGCAALAVVLATGNQYRDLDAGEATDGQHLNAGAPQEQIAQALTSGAESTLYGKTGTANFLGRIGEHLHEWQQAAKRRAWVKLLGNVSKKLDGSAIKVDTVAQEIVIFLKNELAIDDAFVRWRREDNQYELIALATTRDTAYVKVGTSIDPDSVPVLQQIIGQQRDPVVIDSISPQDAGRFAAQIAGHCLLGVGMVLGDRTIGFINLLRSPGRELFQKELEGEYLGVLGRLLASALGRDALMRNRQAGLLEFANNIATARSEKDICDALTLILHRELHDCDDKKGKTTVRLLDTGTGMLQRISLTGRQPEKRDITFTDTSVYSRCVRENKTQRLESACDDNHYVCTDNLGSFESCDHSNSCKVNLQNECKQRGVRSELCVPLAIGEHAIGAVNNEFDKFDYYRSHDITFVEAAANLAAGAIIRIRTARVLEGMTDFVHRFAKEETISLNTRLRNLLYEFCGYSLLVDLEINPEGQWQVKELECRFDGANAKSNEIQKQIESIYAQKFEATWVHKLYAAESWEKEWAHFTDDTNEFMPVVLTRAGDTKYTQQADALLWLQHGGAPPHRALLLMWFLPPPINHTDGVALLGNLAQLFSELDDRKQQTDAWFRQWQRTVQAAQVGYAMQHLRHRLGSLTGTQSTHIDRVEAAHKKGDAARFSNAMRDLRDNALKIANVFNKARAYIKEKPQVKEVDLSDLIQTTTDTLGLTERLAKVTLHQQAPDGLRAWTDAEIASLVLFSLLENALDATEKLTSPEITITAEPQRDKVVLSVTDNGLGVPNSVRGKLFEWGATVKSNGLGSALALARDRMRLLHGDLVFPLPQPAQGALFEIHFPTKPQEQTT